MYAKAHPFNYIPRHSKKLRVEVYIVEEFKLLK